MQEHYQIITSRKVAYSITSQPMAQVVLQTVPTYQLKAPKLDSNRFFCPTWHNFWRNDERNPRDDDEETAGQVGLKQHWGTSANQVDLQ